MDLGWIENLVRLMETADLSEVEIDDSAKGMRVHLKRGAEPGAAPAAPIVQLHPGAAPSAGPASAAGPLRAAPADGPAGPDADADEGTVPFLSPMVGTFYRSSSPEAEPFVSVGTRLSDDSVLCIIEAMKVMNEIKAETRGEVVSVLVENGEPVEFGQPLFLIRPA